ncbi:MAG: hypothetical protein RSE93_02195 [Oscillospiraceae bacterium]
MAKNKKDKKQKNNIKNLSVNEYINLADIRGEFLYSKDNYIWQFIKVEPVSTALMTLNEKSAFVKKLTLEISPMRIPFKILFLTRPTDVRRLVNYYENIKFNTTDQKKRENLTKTIHFFSNMATSNETLERQAFIALWTNKKEEDIKTKTIEFRNALTNAGVKCNICDQVDITNMIGLFYNPIFNVNTVITDTPNYTYMEVNSIEKN